MPTRRGQNVAWEAALPTGYAAGGLLGCLGGVGPWAELGVGLWAVSWVGAGRDPRGAAGLAAWAGRPARHRREMRLPMGCLVAQAPGEDVCPGRHRPGSW